MKKYKYQKLAKAIFALIFIASLLIIAQDTWLKSQFEKNTNYYLNQASVEALNLEIDKELLFYAENGNLPAIKKVLKMKVEENTKVIKERLQDSRHDESSILLMQRSLKYDPRNCNESSLSL